MQASRYSTEGILEKGIQEYCVIFRPEEIPLESEKLCEEVLSWMDEFVENALI